MPQVDTRKFFGEMQGFNASWEGVPARIVIHFATHAQAVPLGGLAAYGLQRSSMTPIIRDAARQKEPR